MPKNQGKVLWFTGMSGSGKSTLANSLYQYAKSNGINAILIDGDSIRNQYTIKIGFTYEDIKKNNLQIAKICKDKINEYSLVIVAVISPYSKIRDDVREYLNQNYYLIHCDASIKSLRKRDVKGLYEKADRNEINNLIGYSKGSVYEEPANPYLKVDTNNEKNIDKNKNLINHLLNKLFFEKNK